MFSRLIKFISLSLVGLVVFLLACKKKDEIPTPVPVGASFSRTAMLDNIGRNIIIKRYEAFTNSTQSLKNAVESFSANADSANLVSLRTSYINAYKEWQKCSAFEFGPGADAILRTNVNTFPCDTNDIKNNVNSGTYNLGIAANIDAKGFPALDYLLYGYGSNFSTISTNLQTANAKKYLKDITDEIHNLSQRVLNEWKPESGNYLAKFTDNTGTELGSPIAMLVNEFNFDYELIKNNKVGIPLGKKTLGTLLPRHVEGYYSGISKDLIIINLESLKELYTGEAGLGLDDLLNSLNAKHTNSTLDEAIQNQIAKALEKCRLIPNPMSDAVVNQTSTVEAAYVELQKTIVLIKTDMPSALTILITYQSNDGD
jgi:uncharacterized protein